MDSRTQEHFDAYCMIVTHAVMFIRSTGFGLPVEEFFNKDVMRSGVVKVAPNSEEGFEKFGDGFGYYWSQYFYDQTLTGLRATANGLEQDELDETAASKLQISTQKAKLDARKALQDQGLPSEYISQPVDVPDIPVPGTK